MSAASTTFEELFTVQDAEQAVAEKLAAARPGTSVVYWAGSSLKGCPHSKKMLADHYRGLWDLSQRKIADNFFAWVATRRRNVKEPPVPHHLRPMVDKLLMETCSE
jgi:hypothetical protein